MRLSIDENLKRQHQLLWLWIAATFTVEALALSSVLRHERGLCAPLIPAATTRSTASFGYPAIKREASGSCLATLFATNDENAHGKGTTPEEYDGEKKSANAEIAPPPPPFLALGYNVAAGLNVVAALVLLCGGGGSLHVPAVATALPSGPAAAARYRPNLPATYVAGALGHLFLAAGACRVLAGATETRRLHASDTYRRLTTGTLFFGLVGLASLPGEAGCLCGTSPAALCGGAAVATQLAKVVTACVSFAGWEYGAGGFGVGPRHRLRNMLRAAAAACRRLRDTLPVSKERPATFYRTFYVFATLGNLAFNLPALAFDLGQGTGLCSLPASLTVSSIARLGLLGAMLYALKEGAEQQRLEETTFVRLNLMIGLWSVGVGLAQGTADGPTAPFNVRRTIDRLLFGALFLNNGLLSQLSKMGIIARRDRVDPEAGPPLRLGL